MERVKIDICNEQLMSDKAWDEPSSFDEMVSNIRRRAGDDSFRNYLEQVADPNNQKGIKINQKGSDLTTSEFLLGALAHKAAEKVYLEEIAEYPDGARWTKIESEVFHIEKNLRRFHHGPKSVTIDGDISVEAGRTGDYGPKYASDWLNPYQRVVKAFAAAGGVATVLAACDVIPPAIVQEVQGQEQPLPMAERETVNDQAELNDAKEIVVFPTDEPEADPTLESTQETLQVCEPQKLFADGYSPHSTVVAITEGGLDSVFGTEGKEQRLVDITTNISDKVAKMVNARVFEQESDVPTPGPTPEAGKNKIIVPGFVRPEDVALSVMDLLQVNTLPFDIEVANPENPVLGDEESVAMVLYGNANGWDIYPIKNASLVQRPDGSFTVAGDMLGFAENGNGPEMHPIPGRQAFGTLDVAIPEGCKSVVVQIQGDQITATLNSEVNFLSDSINDVWTTAEGVEVSQENTYLQDNEARFVEMGFLPDDGQLHNVKKEINGEIREFVGYRHGSLQLLVDKEMIDTSYEFILDVEPDLKEAGEMPLPNPDFSDSEQRLEMIGYFIHAINITEKAIEQYGVDGAKEQGLYFLSRNDKEIDFTWYERYVDFLNNTEESPISGYELERYYTDKNNKITRASLGMINPELPVIFIALPPIMESDYAKENEIIGGHSQAPFGLTMRERASGFFDLRVGVQGELTIFRSDYLFDGKLRYTHRIGSRMMGTAIAIAVGSPIVRREDHRGGQDEFPEILLDKENSLFENWGPDGYPISILSWENPN